MSHFFQVTLPVDLISPLDTANSCNFCAYQGMVDVVQPKDRHAIIVPGAFEIAINKQIGEVLSLPGNQVHHQKRHVADYIDVA